MIAVGYRVNSKHWTKFRIWATQRVKEYLIQGYAINEARLAQKQLEIQTLKDGIRILSRAIEQKAEIRYLSFKNQIELFIKHHIPFTNIDSDRTDLFWIKNYIYKSESILPKRE